MGIACLLVPPAQDNVRLGVQHTDVSLGGRVNLSVPLPTVDVPALSDLQLQVSAKLAALSALLSISNTTSTSSLADWLPADVLSASFMGDSWDKLRAQLQALAPAALLPQDSATTHSAQRPGLAMAAQGYRPKHPVSLESGRRSNHRYQRCYILGGQVGCLHWLVAHNLYLSCSFFSLPPAGDHRPRHVWLAD
jgi:hypothetical protein